MQLSPLNRNAWYFLFLQLACQKDSSKEEVILKMIILEAKGISVAAEAAEHIIETSMVIEVNFQLIMAICLFLEAEVIREVEGNLVSQMSKIRIQLQFQLKTVHISSKCGGIVSSLQSYFAIHMWADLMNFRG